MNQKLKFRFAGVLILAVLSASTGWASPTSDTDPHSRENPSFEAQGDAETVVRGIADTLREWWEAGMLNDGSFEVGYTLQADNPLEHDVDVSLETRIFGMTAHSATSNCDQLGICGSDVLILPVEIHIRADQAGGVSVPNLRVALARLVMNNIGLTAQGFSLIRRDFGRGDTDFFGMEALSLDLNEALDVPGTDGKVEMIFKGSFTFGFGGLRTRDSQIRAPH